MAGTTIAYSEITILDLLDTATYIYYAKDENGTGAAKAPSAESKYMGIYSGPPFTGDPIKFPMDDWKDEWWTGWQKYVGEDGAPGASGKGIKEFEITYAKGDDNATIPDRDWHDTVAEVGLQHGEWLWTRSIPVYDDGTKGEPSYSVTYIGSDGKDANSYYIETNYDEILRFNSYDVLEFSPGILSFKVYKLPIDAQKNSIEEYDYDLAILYNGNMVSIKGRQGISKGRWIEKENEQQELVQEFIGQDSVFVDFQAFLDGLTDSEQDEAIKSSLISERTIFKFSLLGPKQEENAVKIVECRDGLDEEMAKFSVTAAAINAAVRDSRMRFDANGLTLENSAFVLKKGNDNVLYADTDGNLHLTGYIHASGGEFSGSLSSPTGTIGGFEISGYVLQSMNKIGPEGDQTSAIILDGQTGAIYAENIELGQGASVTGQIKLGDRARICSPDANGGIILETLSTDLTEKGIVLKNDGFANFGNIKIDSSTSTISGNGWSIGPDTSFFNNVNISGSIRSAVFEVGTTQSIGSTMILLPSYPVDNIEKVEGGETGEAYLYTDQGNLQNVNEADKIWLVSNNTYNTVVVTEKIDDEGKIKISGYGLENKPTAFMIIGADSVSPLIMGLNGSNSSVADGYVLPRGLTLSSYSHDKEANEAKDIHLYLGDLSQMPDSQYEGYGLYGDNVYLNGSLTTKVGETSYAGVNTLSGVVATAFEANYTPKAVPEETDKSKIVFWAGADSTSEESIQNAYFQVTEQGSIFASRAKLTNSLLVGGEITGTTITGTTIKGVDLYAANIHGSGSSPSLTIYDTQKGIVFKALDETESLSINATGLHFKGQQFVELSNDNVALKGNVLRTALDDNYLQLTTVEGIPALEHSAAVNKCGFYFDTGATYFKIAEKTKIRLEEQQVQLNDSIIFQSQEHGSLQYKEAFEGDGNTYSGYDLFVV